MSLHDNGYDHFHSDHVDENKCYSKDSSDDIHLFLFLTCGNWHLQTCLPRQSLKDSNDRSGVEELSTVTKNKKQFFTLES